MRVKFVDPNPTRKQFKQMKSELLEVYDKSVYKTISRLKCICSHRTPILDRAFETFWTAYYKILTEENDVESVQDRTEFALNTLRGVIDSGHYS